MHGKFHFMKNYKPVCLLLLMMYTTCTYGQWKRYLDSAKVLYNQQKTEQAITLCIRAFEELKKDSAGTRTYTSCCNTLASLYYLRGEYASAKPLYLEARQIREKLLGKQHLDYAASCNNLANLYADMGEYELAEPLYLETKQINSQLLGKQHPEYAGSCTNLGLLYWNKGFYEKAEPLYLEAKAIWELTGKDQAGYARACNNLANLYFDMGQFTQAEPLYREALQIQEGSTGKQHPDYLRSCNNLASLYHMLGQYGKAEPLYLEVKEAREQLLGKQHPEYASSCSNLANIYTKLKQYEKAEPLYLEAKQIRKKVLGEQHPDYARSCRNLASLYEELGRYKQAEPLLLETKSIQARVLGKQHPEYGTTCENLANLYRLLHQPLKASSEYKEAFRVNVHNLLSVFQFTTGKEKAAYIRNILGEDNKAYSFYLSSKTAPGQAYSLALFHRNLILSSLSSFRKQLFASEDTTLKRQYEDWIQVKKKLAGLYSLPVDEREGTAETEEKAGLLEKELTRRSAAFAQQHRPDWHAVQKRLKTGEASIEFVSFRFDNGQQQTDTVMYAAILLKKNMPHPVMISLCSEKQLSGILSSGDKTTVARVQALYGPACTPALYELIWKPLEKNLQGVGRVYFAPAGLLHKIAFAALPVNRKNVLSDKYRLVQLATTASLVESRQGYITASDKIQLYGDISYDADTAVLKDKALSYHISDPVSRSFPDDLTRNGAWSELPATKEEISAIVSSSNRYRSNITSLSGVNATEESVKALDGSASPAVLHIATHGFFFPDPTQQELPGTGTVFKTAEDPLMRSGLLFAGANNAWQYKPVQGIDDGILTSYEVSHLYLPHAKLVVLSACETGLGEIQGSEGVFGLQRAFKIAGAQSLVMSLWKVSDRETAEFMQAFYKKLFAGQSISTAFYNAQKDLKNKYRQKPYKWAAWVLIQ